MFLLNKKLQIKCIYILLLLNVLLYGSKYFAMSMHEDEDEPQVYVPQVYVPKVTEKNGAYHTSMSMEKLRIYSDPKYRTRYGNKEAEEASNILTIMLKRDEKKILSHYPPDSLDRINIGNGGSFALSHIIYEKLIQNKPRNMAKKIFISSGAVGNNGDMEPVGGLFWKILLIFKQKEDKLFEEGDSYIMVFPSSNKEEISIIAKFFDITKLFEKKAFQYLFLNNVKEFENFIELQKPIFNNDFNEEFNDSTFELSDLKDQEKVEFKFLSYLIKQFRNSPYKKILLNLYFEIFVNILLKCELSKQKDISERLSPLLNKIFEEINNFNDFKYAKFFLEKIFKQILNIQFDYTFFKKNNENSYNYETGNKIRNLYINFLEKQKKLLEENTGNSDLYFGNQNIIFTINNKIIENIDWLMYKTQLDMESNSISHLFPESFKKKDFEMGLSAEEKNNLRMLNLDNSSEIPFIFSMYEPFRKICMQWEKGTNMVEYFINVDKDKDLVVEKKQFLDRYDKEIHEWYKQTAEKNCIGRIILENIIKQENSFSLFEVIHRICPNKIAEVILFLLCHFFIEQTEKSHNYSNLYKSCFLRCIKKYIYRIKDKKDVYALVNFYIYFTSINNNIEKEYNDFLLNMISSLVDNDLAKYAYLYYYINDKELTINRDNKNLFNISRNVNASLPVLTFLLSKCNSLYLKSKNKIFADWIVSIISNMKNDQITGQMIEYYYQTKDLALLRKFQEKLKLYCNNPDMSWHIHPWGDTPEHNLSGTVKLNNDLDTKIKELEDI